MGGRFRITLHVSPPWWVGWVVPWEQPGVPPWPAPPMPCGAMAPMALQPHTMASATTVPPQGGWQGGTGVPQPGVGPGSCHCCLIKMIQDNAHNGPAFYHSQVGDFIHLCQWPPMTHPIAPTMDAGPAAAPGPQEHAPFCGCIAAATAPHGCRIWDMSHKQPCIFGPPLVHQAQSHCQQAAQWQDGCHVLQKKTTQ
jgi:hypothetical protein